jgi:hypothetical protein
MTGLLDLVKYCETSQLCDELCFSLRQQFVCGSRFIVFRTRVEERSSSLRSSGCFIFSEEARTISNHELSKSIDYLKNRVPVNDSGLLRYILKHAEAAQLTLMEKNCNQIARLWDVEIRNELMRQRNRTESRGKFGRSLCVNETLRTFITEVCLSTRLQPLLLFLPREAEAEVQSREVEHRGCPRRHLCSEGQSDSAGIEHRRPEQLHMSTYSHSPDVTCMPMVFAH